MPEKCFAKKTMSAGGPARSPAEFGAGGTIGGDVRNLWKFRRWGLRLACIRKVDRAVGLHRSIRLGGALACTALVLVANCTLAPRALGAQQEPTDSEVKAAYLFNFLKFVDWPDDPARDSQAPWVLGVVGDTAVGEDLKQLASGKSVHGRELEVKKVSAPADLRACQILYIAASEKRRLPAMLGELHGASVLTVADMEHFVESGGMIQFVIQDSRVRMAIDVGATSRAHLKVSSKLLSLAVAVMDSTGGAKN